MNSAAIKRWLETPAQFAHENTKKIRTLEYIEELEAQAPRWISVEERLPDGNAGEILVTGADGEVTTAWFVGGMIWFRIGRINVQASGITHWMPLPVPPEEGV